MKLQTKKQKQTNKLLDIQLANIKPKILEDFFKKKKNYLKNINKETCCLISYQPLKYIISLFG